MLRLSFVPKLLVLLIFAVVTTACGVRGGEGGRKGSNVVSQTGVLVYTDSARCPYAEGCGPEFVLMDENFVQRFPITGSIDASLNGQIIKVSGSLTALPEEVVNTPVYDGPDNAISVEQFETVSTLKYRPFLIEAADQHGRARYGCDVLWDKTFAWDASGATPEFIVRMTDVFSKEQQQPYIELRYDANNGELVRETARPTNINPCVMGASG